MVQAGCFITPAYRWRERARGNILDAQTQSLAWVTCPGCCCSIEGRLAEPEPTAARSILGLVSGAQSLWSKPAVLDAALMCGRTQVKVVNNLDWFGPMSFLTFLREIGKFARVGTMLAKDSVSERRTAQPAVAMQRGCPAEVVCKLVCVTG